jgi:hypothetical protein
VRLKSRGLHWPEPVNGGNTECTQNSDQGASWKPAYKSHERKWQDNVKMDTDEIKLILNSFLWRTLILAVDNLHVLRTNAYADWSGTQAGRQELYCCHKGDWPALGKSRQLPQSFPTSHCLAMSLLNENRSIQRPSAFLLKQQWKQNTDSTTYEPTASVV